jgi:trimeric autotransporter adhesin
MNRPTSRAIVLLLGTAASLSAQCTPQWLPVPGDPLNNNVYALHVWDQDGPGPLPPVLAAGGFFHLAGNTPVYCVGTWDGSHWTQIGVGLAGSVHALADYTPSGSTTSHLMAGGWFMNTGGGQHVGMIARWDGSQWHALGGGLEAVGPRGVKSILQFADSLYVGGLFQYAGGTPVDHFARWDGIAWHAMPDNTVSDPDVLYIYQSQLFAGGYFAGVGVRRFTGSTWINYGDPLPISVDSLATYHGELIAGGFFPHYPATIGRNISAHDGTAWHPLGAGTNGPVLAVTTFDPDGPGPLPELLIAGGNFTEAGGQPAYGVAAWDGQQWMPLDQGTNYIVRALTVYNNQLIVGGEFTHAGGLPSPFLAIWGCPQPAPCYANCDQSTGTPLLTVADFSCFLQQFAAAAPYANCDQSTTPPILNIADFTCFLQKFAAGCP